MSEADSSMYGIGAYGDVISEYIISGVLALYRNFFYIEVS